MATAHAVAAQPQTSIIRTPAHIAPAAMATPSISGRPKNHPRTGTAMHMAQAAMRAAPPEAPIASHAVIRPMKAAAVPACATAWPADGLELDEARATGGGGTLMGLLSGRARQHLSVPSASS